MWTAEQLLAEAVGGRVGERFRTLDTVDELTGDLFNNLIPLGRQVALSLSMPLEEVTPPGLDRRWWMVLRRS